MNNSQWYYEQNKSIYQYMKKYNITSEEEFKSNGAIMRICNKIYEEISKDFDISFEEYMRGKYEDMLDFKYL